MGERKFVQTVLVTWPEWPPCPYMVKTLKNLLLRYQKTDGESGGSVVECRTPEREVRGSRPTAAVLCPWARHFTRRKYWLISQEAMAPSRHDWKIVDWDVKPQHNQPTKRPMTLKLGVQHWVLEYYQVCSNYDPGLTVIYFKARSNLVPYAFVREKGKTMYFSKSNGVYDLKLATDDRSDKKFLLT